MLEQRMNLAVKIFLLISLGFCSLLPAGCISKYKLTPISVPEDGGRLVLSSQGNEFNSGTRVTAIAQASLGWRFSRWNGDVESEKGNQVSIVMDKDKTITAYFVKTYELSLVVVPEGAGVLSAQSGRYDKGIEVIVSPQAFYGWRFEKWTGDVESTSEQIIVRMDRDKKVNAQFVKDESDQ